MRSIFLCFSFLLGGCLATVSFPGGEPSGDDVPDDDDDAVGDDDDSRPVWDDDDATADDDDTVADDDDTVADDDDATATWGTSLTAYGDCSFIIGAEPYCWTFEKSDDYLAVIGLDSGQTCVRYQLPEDGAGYGLTMGDGVLYWGHSINLPGPNDHQMNRLDPDTNQFESIPAEDALLVAFDGGLLAEEPGGNDLAWFADWDAVAAGTVGWTSESWLSSYSAHATDDTVVYIDPPGTGDDGVTGLHVTTDYAGSTWLPLTDLDNHITGLDINGDLVVLYDDIDLGWSPHLRSYDLATGTPTGPVVAVQSTGYGSFEGLACPP